MIKVSINNNSHSFKESITITTLISELNLSSNGIAIAINNSVILKTKWEETHLKNQDKITIIQATQGG